MQIGYEEVTRERSGVKGRRREKRDGGRAIEVIAELVVVIKCRN